MRKSTVTTKTDSAGEYEVELFDCKSPKTVVVCSHGKGVRRWDGEHFYHSLAEQYPDRTFLLADQTQPYKDGCAMNSLGISVARVEDLVSQAKQLHPNVPVIIVGHSFGCAVTSQMNLEGVEKVIFVAPTAGDELKKLVRRYGEDVKDGKETTSSDGLTKLLTKDFVESIDGKVWEEEYRKLLKRYKQAYCFESGAEEIVGEERFQHRDMPFADYVIIPDALHNYSGQPFKALCSYLDKLI